MVKNALLFVFILLININTNAQDSTIQINFGVSTNQNGNLISNPSNGELIGLIDSQANNTNVDLKIIDGFAGINKNGTKNADQSINLSSSFTQDSFYGNVQSFGGKQEPTAAFELRNLSPDLFYDISFFASRMGVSDIRETEYSVSGQNESVLYLIASNNQSETVMAKIQPSQDGKITVRITAGPNNNNNFGFYYLGAITLSNAISIPEPVVRDSVLVDFGNIESDSPWNNISNPINGSINNLLNNKNESTGYSISVIDPFTNVNRNGASSPDSSLDISSNAARDSFFVNAGAFGGSINPIGELLLDNLNPNIEYEFSFFASRMGVSDNRETQYKILGRTEETLLLNVSSNTQNSVGAILKPNQDGIIRITVTKGSNNTNSAGFAYLGAMKISYKSDDTTIPTPDSSCRIVILGSSTAAGTGASMLQKSWVGLYRDYLLQENSKLEIINLARGGYTTYHILPTGTSIPPTINITIDEERNLTKALSYNPEAIIVNMPSNDAARNYSADIQINNFDRLKTAANEFNIPIWIATTQPRNFSNPDLVQIQRETTNRIMERYGDFAIDFWTGTSDSNGFILEEYNSGDGIHLNDLGHELLFNKVLEKNIEGEICNVSSAEKNVNGQNGDVFSLKAYKNGNENYLEVLSNDKGVLELQIFDLLGRNILKSSNRINSGRTIIKLDVSLLDKRNNRILVGKAAYESDSHIINSTVKFVK